MADSDTKGIAELIKILTSPGDSAVVTISYAVGFFVDNFFFPEGVESAIVAGITTAGAYGCKKVFDLTAGKKFYTANLEQKAQITEAYVAFLVDQNDPAPQHLLNVQQNFKEELAAWRGGIIKNRKFRKSLSTTRAECHKGYKQLIEKHLLTP